MSGDVSTLETAARLPSAIGPAVTILLCTLNGERFLAEQLASLEWQTFKSWKLIASDDGSSDRTKSILLAFQRSFEPGKVEIIDGPRRGAPTNFPCGLCGKSYQRILRLLRPGRRMGGRQIGSRDQCAGASRPRYSRALRLAHEADQRRRKRDRLFPAFLQKADVPELARAKHPAETP
jgi:glycosyltransferase involved in cell wall biosynthesis